jgi:hypothetical protein
VFERPARPQSEQGYSCLDEYQINATENVMTTSMKAAKKVTVRRFAKAAIVAALLCTPAAAQAAGRAMPDNCQENLNQCSLKIWGHNTFPHAGVQQSVTFSNGMVLTCTSNGSNTPRSCTLK